MKKLYSILSLFLFSLCTYGQTTISVNPATAELLLSGTKIKSPAKAKMDAPRLVYIAQQPGYITQGVSVQQLKDAKATDYIMALEKVSKLPEGYTSKKIRLAGFVDNEHYATTWESGNSYYNTDFFLNEINKDMINYGYNAIVINTVFTEKKSAADYVIAGDIIALSKGTRGSGFQVSLIVKWNVYDSKKEEVVLYLTTAGYSEVHETMFEEVCKSALRNSVPALMQNAEFQKLVSDKKISVKKDTTELIIEKTIASKPASNAELSKKSLASVVTIKTDKGHGSGFIISSNGYVLTNAHVIEDAEKTDVIFNNGFEFEAKLLKIDSERDVALLQIKGKGFTPLPLELDSEQIQPGTEVIAIGTPEFQELNQSVTKGIISGKRIIENHNYLQTDVAINSGNSGGPIINTDNGKVIAMVVGKIKAVGVEGINFGIPIQECLSALNIKVE